MAQAGVSIRRHESEGSSWEAAERSRLPDGLAPYVRRMIGYDERSASLLRRREVPTGSVTVIIGLGDPVVVDMPSQATTPGALTSFVAGLSTAPALVDSRHQRGVQLDLTPLGAYRLFGMPMSELANEVVSLDAVRGRSISELNERLAATASWTDRFGLVDRTLLAWADEGPNPDRPVVWAWNQLVGSHGQVPVGVLADEIGWSRRHFVDRFRRQVGLAPKPAGRVLRFERAVALLGSPSVDRTIASVAALCGYADHSHMVREFQELAGCTPSQYVDSLLAEGFGSGG